MVAQICALGLLVKDVTAHQCTLFRGSLILTIDGVDIVTFFKDKMQVRHKSQFICIFFV